MGARENAGGCFFGVFLSILLPYSVYVHKAMANLCHGNASFL